MEHPRRKWLLRFTAIVALAVPALPLGYRLFGEGVKAVAVRRFEREVGPMDPWGWIGPTESSSGGPLRRLSVQALIASESLYPEAVWDCLDATDLATPRLRQALSRYEGDVAELRRRLSGGAIRDASVRNSFDTERRLRNLAVVGACEGLVGIEDGYPEIALDRVELLGALATAAATPFLYRGEWTATVAEAQQLRILQRLVATTDVPSATLERAAEAIPEFDPIAMSRRAAGLEFLWRYTQLGVDAPVETDSNLPFIRRIRHEIDGHLRRLHAPFVEAEFIGRAREILREFPSSIVDADAKPGWPQRVERMLVELEHGEEGWLFMLPYVLRSPAHQLEQSATLATCRRLAREAVALRRIGAGIGSYPKELAATAPAPRADLLRGTRFEWTVRVDGSATLSAPGAAAVFGDASRFERVVLEWQLPSPAELGR